MTPLVDPNLTNPETVLGALDFAGVAVFAATGALAAAQQRHDLVTFAFFGAITGVGGGTLRDLLIGAPVFWVQDWRYIAICVAASVAVWVVGARPWRFRALLWLDAIGLAAYGVFGAAKAELFGVAPLICIVMGALTACFGGIVRDLLAGQPSILLRREITVSAALLAATIFVAARVLGLDAWPAALIAAPCGFALRAGARSGAGVSRGFRGPHRAAERYGTVAGRSSPSLRIRSRLARSQGRRRVFSPVALMIVTMTARP